MSKNVCNSQDDFNEALHEAVDFSRKKEEKQNKPWVYVWGVIWMVFLVWGIILALKVPEGPERVEHVMFAMFFGPLYILAHYLSISDVSSVQMGLHRRPL